MCSIRDEESIVKAVPSDIDEPGIFEAVEKLEDTTDAFLVRSVMLPKLQLVFDYFIAYEQVKYLVHLWHKPVRLV